MHSRCPVKSNKNILWSIENVEKVSVNKIHAQNFVKLTWLVQTIIKVCNLKLKESGKYFSK